MHFDCRTDAIKTMLEPIKGNNGQLHVMDMMTGNIVGAVAASDDGGWMEIYVEFHGSVNTSGDGVDDGHARIIDEASNPGRPVSIRLKRPVRFFIDNEPGRNGRMKPPAFRQFLIKKNVGGIDCEVGLSIPPDGVFQDWCASNNCTPIPCPNYSQICAEWAEMYLRNGTHRPVTPLRSDDFTATVDDSAML